LYFSGKFLIKYELIIIGILNFVLKFSEVLEIYGLNAIYKRVKNFNINYNTGII